MRTGSLLSVAACVAQCYRNTNDGRGCATAQVGQRLSEIPFCYEGRFAPPDGC
jgi:hypothetical protein